MTAAQQADETALVAALRRKDRKAAAEFVQLHSDALYSYLSSRLAPREDLVEDALQEVFVAAWENLERFEGRSSLRGWLLGIARHKVEDHYRRRLREPLPLTETDDGPPPPEAVSEPEAEEWMDARRRQERAWEVLDSLPEMYRVVLVWRYWERCSTADMADRSGKTVKAIERLLARAREQFKRSWEA